MGGTASLCDHLISEPQLFSSDYVSNGGNFHFTVIFHEASELECCPLGDVLFYWMLFLVVAQVISWHGHWKGE